MDTKKSSSAHIVFHYQGFFEDGTVFFDSYQGDPMEIDTGMHMVMPQLEEALKQMREGEMRDVFVGEAYGSYDEDALQTGILKSSIPHGESLHEGLEIMWTSPNNPHQPIPARIARDDTHSFDIDFNHPLAGKSLMYRVELISIT